MVSHTVDEASRFASYEPRGTHVQPDDGGTLTNHFVRKPTMQHLSDPGPSILNRNHVIFATAAEARPNHSELVVTYLYYAPKGSFRANLAWCYQPASGGTR
ncbi:hypothetical protein H112_03117 [Trichophyton rubrum D6]|uniref:Uncharacterized protein n=4 Tax=Trichophyton TaxID=5550 RepID=A0A178EXA5_TRIRU|nr:uncharacterized protein TERG_08872 [Trichophyton rubrum CBS 118892]EZF24242.1 hypothetical protein H100_03123 [Trichophyton rubrum MR850]EZF43405.1 hypothetical protein H102_03116 [Trichophyton rubrum CBS 100081]EZF54047.1 hypothetical protein H103_03130 [Trichophyton rubrum CBS 288.86]EZF64649.1 hypothetical protein H104_03112 [Trichophyton rubrum CBS 289.86]EZF85953.1 hypothetical protein H110_03124 [Trichophyton rubrum MR1448]EZG07681.1 hypothetical protein H106_02964 [Trichophyton rubr